MNNAVETPWSHLPNAVHINRIFDSVKARPEVWVAAYISAHGVPRDAARDAARYAARDTARDVALAATRVEAWDAAWDAARDAAWDAAWDAVWDVARAAPLDPPMDAARDAVLALVAYDDAAQYLDFTLDELKDVYASTGHPATILLQPAVVAFASINSGVEL